MRCIIRPGPRGVQHQDGDLEADPFTIRANLLRCVFAANRFQNLVLLHL